MNMQPNDLDAGVKTELVFLTGWGEQDSHTLSLHAGGPNPHSNAGTPYTGISGRELVVMIKAPQTCAKDSAQWFIPSAYRLCEGRNHEVQRQNGEYWFLSIDIDKNNLDPPERAVVLCVDEKSQIQALDRAQPGLPLKKCRDVVLETRLRHDDPRLQAPRHDHPVRGARCEVWPSYRGMPAAAPAARQCIFFRCARGARNFCAFCAASTAPFSSRATSIWCLAVKRIRKQSGFEQR